MSPMPRPYGPLSSSTTNTTHRSSGDAPHEDTGKGKSAEDTPQHTGTLQYPGATTGGALTAPQHREEDEGGGDYRTRTEHTHAGGGWCHRYSQHPLTATFSASRGKTNMKRTEG